MAILSLNKVTVEPMHYDQVASLVKSLYYPGLDPTLNQKLKGDVHKSRHHFLSGPLKSLPIYFLIDKTSVMSLLHLSHSTIVVFSFSAL